MRPPSGKRVYQAHPVGGGGTAFNARADASREDAGQKSAGKHADDSNTSQSIKGCLVRSPRYSA
jgi:hypothetical protein